MNLEKFINRPVLSTVISILIVILGILGVATLPITQYPDIAPPTVQVSASYQGANAQTVLNSVIAPLEEEINGVENMTYITSTATNTGDATINVYFKPGSDPDMAAVNVQNRVAKAVRSNQGRSHNQQASVQHIACRNQIQFRRPIRRNIPVQLHEDKPRAADKTSKRCRRRKRSRSRIFNADMAETRRNGAIFADAVRHTGTT